MPAVPAPARVLLTGASGFIAAHIGVRLIKEGFTVVGTVRSPSKGDYLVKLLGDKFTYAIVKDLASETAFDDVVKTGEFDAIVHAASPVTLTKGSVESVITPAVVGTKSVLEAARKYGPTVKRIVITSSVASIVNSFDDGIVWTEKDFNHNSSKVIEELGDKAPNKHFYNASKSIAEQAAWKFIETYKSEIKFDLTTIHPSFVFGPVIQEVTRGDISTLNETSAMLITFLKASPEVEPLVKLVDVRDVADAHVLAVTTPKAAYERFIIDAGRNDIYEWKKWAIESGAEGIGKLGKQETDTSGSTFDNSKSKDILKVKYLSGRETLLDSLKTYQELFPLEFKS